MTLPTSSSTPIDEALDHIAASDAVWVRIAATRVDVGVWKARLAEVISGDAPPSWEQREWQYPSALLTAALLSGKEVAAGLRLGSLQLGDHKIALSEMTNVVRWEHRQSRSLGPYETLSWPVTEATLATMANTEAEPQGHMVSDQATPSFISFYAAGASFFSLDQQPGGGSLSQGIIYRHQDLRARITSVRIANDSVEVGVDGADIDGLVVELSGNAPGPVKQIWRRHGEDPQTVSFDLKEGLPAGSWVLLRRGAEWLDRRFLSVPYARGNEAGVEIVVDAGTRLEALVSSRERQQVEYKQQLPGDNETKLKVMKTICAFANGQGGSLLVGVDDDRQIVGVDEPSVDRLRDQLTQMIGSWIEPRPSGNFEVLPISDSDKVVLEYWVEPGAALFGCGRPGEVRAAYVRHHGITERATVTEIAAIVQERTHSPSFSAFT